MAVLGDCLLQVRVHLIAKVSAQASASIGLRHGLCALLKRAAGVPKFVQAKWRVWLRKSGRLYSANFADGFWRDARSRVWQLLSLWKWNAPSLTVTADMILVLDLVQYIRTARGALPAASKADRMRSGYELAFGFTTISSILIAVAACPACSAWLQTCMYTSKLCSFSEWTSTQVSSRYREWHICAELSASLLQLQEDDRRRPPHRLM